MSDSATYGQYAYPCNDIVAIQIRDGKEKKDWEKVQKNCEGLNEGGVKVLRWGLDKHVKTVAIELRYICKDYRNLYSHYHSRKFKNPGLNCCRLHFFEQAVTPKEILGGDEQAKTSYMGYAVIRPIRMCLGRTVIDPEKIGRGYPAGYCCLKTRFTVRINGAEYTVKGYPYTAQDGEATVCAHSALWGVCRYYSERYHTYAEVYPFDFIKMTRSREGRAYPNRGMTYHDYCEILTDFGTFPIYRILNRPKHDPKPGWDDEAFRVMYCLVESGFPVLASLGKEKGQSHVVALIGHTSDFSKMKKEVKPGQPYETEKSNHDLKLPIIDSSRFLTSFVVCDDNYFPYRRLGMMGGEDNDYVKDAEKMEKPEEAEAKKRHWMEIKAITCPLPEKIYLIPEKARQKALRYIGEKFSEIQASVPPEMQNQPFVTRLFLTTCNALRAAMMKLGNDEADEAADLISRIHMPHFIWVMEIAPMALFTKTTGQRAAGLIILDSTSGLCSNETGVIAIRIGNSVFLPKSISVTSYKKTTYSDSSKDFPLFRHNLGNLALLML